MHRPNDGAVLSKDGMFFQPVDLFQKATQTRSVSATEVMTKLN